MAPLASIGGLASGMDTASIIDQLISLERAPVDKMAAKQSNLNQQRIAWTKLGADAKSIGDKAQALATASRLFTTVTTSSKPEAVTVTGTAPAGSSLSFKVTSLARSSQSVTTGFTSASQVVGAGKVAISTGIERLGISKVSAGSAAAGAHNVAVTTASDVGRLTSSKGPSFTTIGGTMSISVSGGAAVNVNITSGAHTSDDVVATINTALTAAGAAARAAVVGGKIQLATTNEGSAATLAVSGTAAIDLGLAGNAAGTSAVVSVDGTSYNINDVRAGATATAGGMTLTLSGPLRLGSATTTVATVGAGATVADVAAAVNASGAAAATVLNTGDPALGTEIMYTAKSSGTANAISVALDGFASSYQSTQVRTGTDATIVMGSQTITRSSNTFSDFIAGATITLNALTTDDVTLTSSRDNAGAATKVKDFVNSVNAYLADVASYTKNDPTGKANGVLQGDASLRAMNLSLKRAITDSYGSGAVTVMSQIGVRVLREGNLSFDEAAFNKALADNPDGVANVLARAGAATGSVNSAQMTYSSATANTTVGSYGVVVTAAATTAQLSSGSFATLANAEDFTFSYGASNPTTATFSAGQGVAGASLATDLNAFFTTKAMPLLAEYAGGVLTVRSSSYGSSASFSVTSTRGTMSGSATGTDVAGTIGGAAATGSGQTLTGAAGSGAAGLGVKVTSTSAQVAAAGGSLSLGTMKYTAGLGGVIDTLITKAREESGMFSAVLTSVDTQHANLQKNIDAANARLERRRTVLQKQFSAMELAMSKLQSNTPDFSSLKARNND